MRSGSNGEKGSGESTEIMANDVLYFYQCKPFAQADEAKEICGMT